MPFGFQGFSQIPQMMQQNVQDRAFLSGGAVSGFAQPQQPQQLPPRFYDVPEVTDYDYRLMNPMQQQQYMHGTGRGYAYDQQNTQPPIPAPDVNQGAMSFGMANPYMQSNFVNNMYNQGAYNMPYMPNLEAARWAWW